MECRGIGVISVSHMFGINALRRKVLISYCLNLVKLDSNTNFERLGNLKNETIDFLGVNIPVVTLPVSPGRSMAEVIEVAVTNLKLKAAGVDTANEFVKRLDEFRKKAK